MANKEVGGGGGGRGDGTSFRSKFMAEFSAADRGDVSTLRDTIGGYKKKVLLLLPAPALSASDSPAPTST